jgi:hypothetical protein
MIVESGEEFGRQIDGAKNGENGQKGVPGIQRHEQGEGLTIAHQVPSAKNDNDIGQ